MTDGDGGREGETSTEVEMKKNKRNGEKGKKVFFAPSSSFRL